MTADDWAALRRQLIRHEGLRLKPYVDTVGKTTIGVGRNLTDKGISENEAIDLLRNDYVEVYHDLCAKLPWFTGLSAIRQRVLIEMGFNQGSAGLLKFTKTLASMERGDYVLAAEQMLLSRWAKQVGQRARRLAAMMKTNEEQP